MDNESLIDLQATESPTIAALPNVITMPGPGDVIEDHSVDEWEDPGDSCSPGHIQIPPEQDDGITPSSLLGQFEHDKRVADDHDKRVAELKEQLRNSWHKGKTWRLEFGRLLNVLRDEIQHGEWIKFIQSEFGLDRQTAYNWMNKAKKADGISLDEPTKHDDEPDAHADQVETTIQNSRNELEEAKNNNPQSAVKLNGPKPRRLILDAATQDDWEHYQDEVKRNHAWSQEILRRAFDDIRLGKPVVPDDAKPVEHTRKLGTMLAADFYDISDNDQPNCDQPTVGDEQPDDQPSIDDNDLPEIFAEPPEDSDNVKEHDRSDDECDDGLADEECIALLHDTCAQDPAMGGAIAEGSFPEPEDGTNASA